MDAKVTDFGNEQDERLSLNTPPVMEQIWENSGFPVGLWRRLHKIDALARSASHIAEILAIDRQNTGLANDVGEEYKPLSPYHTGGLAEAMDLLIAEACEGLEELRDFPHKFSVTIEERHGPVKEHGA